MYDGRPKHKTATKRGDQNVIRLEQGKSAHRRLLCLVLHEGLLSQVIF